MKKSILLLIVFVSATALFNACKKSDDNKANDADIMTSEDLATNEDFSEEIDFAVDVAIEDRGGPGACPVVTLDQPWGTWPNKITIDYGPDGCTGPNGDHLLKGKIIVEQSAEMFTAGATRTKTFEDFYVDDVKVEGSKSWINNGLDAAGNWSYTKTATNMLLSYPDGTTSSWNHTHTSTLIQGALTLTHWDNIWSTTGASSGVNRNGVSYSATITEPLIKKATCRWISEGVVEFTRDGNTSTLNFGNGTCDRFATLTTASGDTFTILLRR
ncbi:MAG: hypothetical protein H6565_09075 [Lewinellaceae bacterium]|nr:hypothetical protein [Saprospiraceae bacterium]MCB9306737.1 hypothetical protein [Lewinellaceae bacterium]